MTRNGTFPSRAREVTLPTAHAFSRSPLRRRLTSCRDRPSTRASTSALFAASRVRCRRSVRRLPLQLLARTSERRPPSRRGMSRLGHGATPGVRPLGMRPVGHTLAPRPASNFVAGGGRRALRDRRGLAPRGISWRCPARRVWTLVARSASCVTASSPLSSRRDLRTRTHAFVAAIGPPSCSRSLSTCLQVLRPSVRVAWVGAPMFWARIRRVDRRADRRPALWPRRAARGGAPPQPDSTCTLGPATGTSGR